MKHLLKQKSVLSNLVLTGLRGVGKTVKPLPQINLEIDLKGSGAPGRQAEGRIGIRMVCDDRREVGDSGPELAVGRDGDLALAQWVGDCSISIKGGNNESRRARS